MGARVSADARPKLPQEGKARRTARRIRTVALTLAMSPSGILALVQVPSQTSSFGRAVAGPRLRSHTVVLRSGTEDKEEPKERGYRFGDLLINKVTGKDEYEFGDLSRWLGSKFQETACAITGKDSYEFGDISRFLDQKAKEQVRELTGKEEYEFGDITKEILRRVRDGEVSPEDMSLLIRALLTFGVGLTPVASALPVQVLLSVLNWNLQAEVSQRASKAVSDTVAKELDKRAKKALLGKEDYVIGDYTKERLARAVSSITGKEKYEFGDLTRAVAAKLGSMNTELKAPASASPQGEGKP